jgi:hypothetical protein
LLRVKHGADAHGGSHQAAVVNCSRDGSIAELFAADDGGDKSQVSPAVV